MKFFNWMHRKLLNPSVVYSRVPHKQQTDVFSDHVKENEADEALLLGNVLDRILTIGTLGIDNNSNSLIIDDQHQEYYEDDEKDHDQQDKRQEQEEQEVKVAVPPLVVTKQSTRLKENEEKKSNVEVLVTLEVKNDQHSHKEHMTEPLLKEDKEKKESKRTTLAELFAASDLPLEKASVPWKEKTVKTNYIASKWKLNKKIVDEKRTKEEKSTKKKDTTKISSTKKAQKLITKVLKKKIHPEMGAGGLMKTESMVLQDMEKIRLVG